MRKNASVGVRSSVAPAWSLTVFLNEPISTGVVFSSPMSSLPSRRATRPGASSKPKQGNPKRIGGLAPSQFASSEIARLYSQIAAHPRKLVIAAGNYPLWALSQVTSTKVATSSNNRYIPKDLQNLNPGGILSWRGSMWTCSPHQEIGANGFPEIAAAAHRASGGDHPGVVPSRPNYPRPEDPRPPRSRQRLAR